MGVNTVVMLLNDMAQKWPKEILDAMAQWGYSSQGRDHTDFGYGHVVSVSHADEKQVCVISQNCGRFINATQEASKEDLEALADVLLAHGYSVRAPDQKRARPPYRWGYWGKRQREQATLEKS